MIFTSLALLQLGNALAVRSEHESVFRLGLGRNRFQGWTVLGTLLVQLGLLYWPPARAALDLQPLALADLAIVLVASTATFWAIEAEKLTTRLRASRPTPPEGRSGRRRPVEADQHAGQLEEPEQKVGAHGS
jgi:Ca2+-transporting ATPase